MYTLSSYEMEEIDDIIDRAYTNVCMLKCIGSRKIQINPKSFSKGYWAAIDKTLDRRDKRNM